MAEQLIAGGVTERVVDLFEVVQVHEQKRQPVVVTPVFVTSKEVFVTSKEVVQDAEQVTTVGQAGEFVRHRLLTALLTERLHEAY